MNAERRSRIEITAPGPLGAPGSRRDAAHPLAFTARGALAIAASAVLALALAGCGSSGSNSGSGAAPAPIAGSSATGSTGTDSVAPHSAPPALEAGAELGEKVFKQRCVLCHGSEGRGNGAAAAALKPNPPRNFHDSTYMKSRTDEQLLLSIHNGKNAMPPWKNILNETEIKSVLIYVRKFADQP